MAITITETPDSFYEADLHLAAISKPTRSLSFDEYRHLSRLRAFQPQETDAPYDNTVQRIITAYQQRSRLQYEIRVGKLHQIETLRECGNVHPDGSSLRFERFYTFYDLTDYWPNTPDHLRESSRNNEIDRRIHRKDNDIVAEWGRIVPLTSVCERLEVFTNLVQELVETSQTIGAIFTYTGNSGNIRINVTIMFRYSAYDFKIYQRGRITPRLYTLLKG